MSVGQAGGTDALTMQKIEQLISANDVDTLMLMVQGERTKLLDSQLKSQISDIQKRNAQIAKLNNVSSALNGLLNLYPASDKDNSKMKDAKIPNWNKAGSAEDNRYKQMRDSLYAAMKDAGMDANAADGSYALNIKGGLNEVTKGSLNTAIQVVKNQVDALSNTQQTDMLRLQSLSNKRNEAFDLMTNSVKKKDDSNSAIIRNMG